MRSSKPLTEFSAAAHNEGKSLLDALMKFIYQHRQEIKASHLGTEASNLLQNMKQLVSGFEQLATTESSHVRLAELARSILEQTPLAHKDGDVWYDGKRTSNVRELHPWGAMYEGDEQYFLTKKSAERFAETGSGKFDESLDESTATSTPGVRTYAQRCTHCGRTGGVEARSADDALDALRDKGWLLRVGGSLCPRCRKAAVTTEALPFKTYGNVNPLSNPTWDKIREPWHKQLDGFVADIAEFHGKTPFHPLTNQPLTKTQLKPQTNKEGEVELWQGTVDGVKLTIFND